MNNLETSLEPLQSLKPAVPVLPENSGDEDSECSDQNSAQSRDSERTLFYPDLYVLTIDEHWTMTAETHKYAAAAGSFCVSMMKMENNRTCAI